MQSAGSKGYVDPDLQATLDRAIATLEDRFSPAGIQRETLSITVIDCAARPVTWAHHQGDRLVYPASIIKLYFLVASHVWEDSGRIAPTAELERARRNAIVHSSNDATSLIVDLLTDTTSGPDLTEAGFHIWQQRRHILTRYFHAVGIPGNFCQKTWSDGPYGRDRQSYQLNGDNRNALSSNSTAWLLHTIAAGLAVSPARSRAMLELMERDLDPTTYADDPDNQIQGFLGQGLPRTARLWSKAGETTFCRHDCALIQLPEREPYILVAFGDGPAYFENWDWLPLLSEFWVGHFSSPSRLSLSGAGRE
jgi:beta-lactamase class A